MLILNSKGQQIDPQAILPFKIDQFDLIYGALTVGKTTLIEKTFFPAPDQHAQRFIETDQIWTALFPTIHIWEVKRVSPEVDNALSAMIRFVARELAKVEDRPVMTNMNLPFGKCLKVFRDGPDTWSHMTARAKKKGTSLKITKASVLSWAQSWTKHEPEYQYSILLEKDEYLSDLFDLKSGRKPTEGELLNDHIAMLMKAFPESTKVLVTPNEALDVAWSKTRSHAQ